MFRSSGFQRVLAAVTVAALAVAGLMVVGTSPVGATPSSQTFSTPGSSTFTVPSGVTTLAIVAQGGAGAGGTINGWTSVGGQGGRQTATIPVTPGEILNIEVGGAAVADVGGYNGGGSAEPGLIAGGGGGASDVRQGGASLANRVVVAGGGGGGGRSGPGSQGGTGGDGGGTNGSDAFPDSVGPFFGIPGGGGGAGTTSAGGAAGATNSYLGNPGTFGVGGAGPAGCEVGGAGGGGYYGGGSGSSGCWAGGGAGGGGSNYAAPSATAVLSENGVSPSDGSVVLTWTAAPPTTTAAPTTTVAPAPISPIKPALAGVPKKLGSCPTTPIRIRPNSNWAVAMLRFWCGSRVTFLRNGNVRVGYVVPRTWRWAWTAKPSSTR